MKIHHTGNIYANLIHDIGLPPGKRLLNNELKNIKVQVLKGAIYDSGIELNDDSNK